MNKKELLSKFSNKFWRLNNLYKIIDKQSNEIFFKENTIQKIINRSKSKRKVILKARQFGVSTNIELLLFDETVWNRNQNNCILAHEQDAIKKLFRIINRAYNFMDDSIKPFTERGKGSKYELYFPKTNSRIYCDMESRSDTIHNLHISEMAFMKDPMKVLATIEAVPIDGNIFIESTPNGMGNYFYDFWQDTQYEKLFFPWFVHPEYQIKGNEELNYSNEELELKEKAKRYEVNLSDDQIRWRRFKIRDLKAIFYQEYPEDDQNCFLTSGNTVINTEQLKILQKNAKNPILTMDCVKIFAEYNKNFSYVCGVDTSEGVKKDASVAMIFCCETMEQVAIYRSKKIKPTEFAYEINNLCKHFSLSGHRMPLLAVERNNHGHTVLAELGNNHMNYPNLFVHTDERPGWLTNRLTRPIMVNAFIDGIDSGKLKLNDETTIKECFTLINNEGKIEAAPNKNDDCIMASAIALQMVIQNQHLSFYKNIGSKIKI